MTSGSLSKEVDACCFFNKPWLEFCVKKALKEHKSKPSLLKTYETEWLEEVCFLDSTVSFFYYIIKNFQCSFCELVMPFISLVE